MISGGVSFNFVQDYWFAQFLHKLRPSFSLPSRTTLTDNYMVQLYADAVKERDEILSKIDCCTVLWDGWTDSSHNSIYGMMVLHGSDNQSELIDIVNLSMERHTATNMVNIVSDLWERSALKLSAIKCLVTNSPNVMLKFRREIKQVYQHIITLLCALHVANTLCKDICKVRSVSEIVKANCSIVNFFTASHLWFAQANKWAKENMDHCYSFKALCESRWYSMTKVCMSVSYYQEFLLQAIKNQGTSDLYPKMKEQVIMSITERHFLDNKDLVKIMSPLADLIGNLEKASTTLADIYVQFIKLHVYYKNMSLDLFYRNAFVSEAQKLLSKRSRQYFNDPIYAIVLFLVPMHRDFAVSKNFSFDFIKKNIIEIAIKWKWSKSECITLNQEMAKYSSFLFSQAHLKMKPGSFWSSTHHFSEPTRRFCDYVFKLKGQAAPVETVFSTLSYIKPKIRNRLTSENLKIIGTIRRSLRRQIPTTFRNKRKVRETDGVESYEEETLKDLGLEDESEQVDLCDMFEAIVNEVDDTLLEEEESVHVNYFEEMFDMTLFESCESTSTSQQNDTENNIEDGGENDFTVDDILNL